MVNIKIQSPAISFKVITPRTETRVICRRRGCQLRHMAVGVNKNNLNSKKPLAQDWSTETIEPCFPHAMGDCDQILGYIRCCIGSYPDSKIHGANMGPIWGRQDPGGPHVGPMNFAIWVMLDIRLKYICNL